MNTLIWRDRIAGTVALACLLASIVGSLCITSAIAESQQSSPAQNGACGASALRADLCHPIFGASRRNGHPALDRALQDPHPCCHPAAQPAAQAIAIDAWMKKNIRYVAIYLSSGRVIANDAAAVLRNKFGDCKDKATLLSALLTAKGIASEQVLINLGNAYTLLLPIRSSSRKRSRRPARSLPIRNAGSTSSTRSIRTVLRRNYLFFALSSSRKTAKLPSSAEQDLPIFHKAIRATNAIGASRTA